MRKANHLAAERCRHLQHCTLLGRCRLPSLQAPAYVRMRWPKASRPTPHLSSNTGYTVNRPSLHRFHSWRDHSLQCSPSGTQNGGSGHTESTASSSRPSLLLPESTGTQLPTRCSVLHGSPSCQCPSSPRGYLKARMQTRTYGKVCLPAMLQACARELVAVMVAVGCL